MDIPPQVDPDSATVYLNGYELTVNGRKCVNLVCSKDGCIISEAELELPVMYKGSGIIDVYLDPVKVINCRCGNEYFDKTAEAFKMPSTNTYETKSADYPVFSSTDDILYDEVFRSRNSFVVIDSTDSAERNSFLDIIRRKLHVCTNNEK